MTRITYKVAGHTLKKLGILQDYLKAYCIATKNAQRFTYYIDLFAGCGKVEHKTTGESRNGSPLVALELNPGFSKCLFVESEPAGCESLREYIDSYPPEIGAKASIFCGDCNVEIEKVLAQVPQKNPAFAFLDPYAHELWWTTVAKLANHREAPYRKIELFILFAYNMALVRLMTHEAETFYRNGWDEIFDKVMPPSSRWRDIYEEKLSGTIDSVEVRRLFLAEYIDGLKSLNYKHVPPPRLIWSDSGHPLYFLLFATDHPVGEKIMVSCFGKPRHGEQMSMLRYFERY